MTIEKLLTAREVADILRLSPQYVRTLASRGKIPSVRIGSSIRFRRAAIERFIGESDQVLVGQTEQGRRQVIRLRPIQAGKTEAAGEEILPPPSPSMEDMLEF